MIRSQAISLLAASLLAACGSEVPAINPEPVQTLAEAPPGAPPGTCWGKDVTPAVVETVTEQVLARPAELRADGSVARPAVYRTETRQEIVEARRETWFETLCAEALTPEFVASLQRALRARGLYRGTITGEMDRRTRAAVRTFQTPRGLNSGILSISAARQMGLTAVKSI